MDATQGPTARITVDGENVTIEGLSVCDGVLAEYLGDFAAPDREVEISKILAVGVRGMTAMVTGATVRGVGEEVERALEAVTSAAEARAREIIDAGRTTLAGSLDPDVRSSLTAKTLTEIEQAHRSLLTQLDPGRADSHTSRLITELTKLLGPGGMLAERLRETFDPGADTSAMSRVLSTIDHHFRDLRELIAAETARTAEAHRGTAKGLEYEERVVEELRAVAAEIGGCTVEATGTVEGLLEAGAKVGDAVLTLPDGTRVAVEAKNTSHVALTGKHGILEELDRAARNRRATWAICISAEDAFPREVGSFGIYDRRVLVVDDGDGVLLRVALRWVKTLSALSAGDSPAVDTEALHSVLGRLRALAQRFSGAKRALSTVSTSVDQVRSELDLLRVDLLELADELHVVIRSAGGDRRAA